MIKILLNKQEFISQNYTLSIAYGLLKCEVRIFKITNSNYAINIYQI